MVTPILQILAAGLGMFASWWIGKLVLKWVQAWQNVSNKLEKERQLRLTLEAARQANRDADHLKEIEDSLNVNGTKPIKPQ